MRGTPIRQKVTFSNKRHRSSTNDLLARKPLFSNDSPFSSMKSIFIDRRKLYVVTTLLRSNWCSGHLLVFGTRTTAVLNTARCMPHHAHCSGVLRSYPKVLRIETWHNFVMQPLLYIVGFEEDFQRMCSDQFFSFFVHCTRPDLGVGWTRVF